MLLIGPRQVGKTTLAQFIGETRDSLYLDLQDEADRNKLVEPALFLDPFEHVLVILDEVHRMPEIFATLRGIIDRGRRKGNRFGRFLILGSASIDLLRQSSESLAGRAAHVSLGPLSVLEVDNDRSIRDLLWLRGGFPDSYLSKSGRDSFLWRRDFIRMYLERDVFGYGFRYPPSFLQRLWVILAHSQGGVLNASEIARTIDISVQSVTRYIDLLVDLLLVRRLQPFRSNIGKRMVKSPKVYVRDSGLLHALLGIRTLNDLCSHPVMGRSWEGWAIESLLSVLEWGSSAYFYRTRAGAEIGLVIEHGPQEVWAIEIKRSLKAKVSRGFYAGCEGLRPAQRFLVNASDDRYRTQHNVEVIGLRAMTEELVRLK